MNILISYFDSMYTSMYVYDRYSYFILEDLSKASSYILFSAHLQLFPYVMFAYMTPTFQKITHYNKITISFLDIFSNSSSIIDWIFEFYLTLSSEQKFKRV